MIALGIYKYTFIGILQILLSCAGFAFPVSNIVNLLYIIMIKILSDYTHTFDGYIYIRENKSIIAWIIAIIKIVYIYIVLKNNKKKRIFL